MTSCPYCGSSIDEMALACQSCREPLVGDLARQPLINGTPRTTPYKIDGEWHFEPRVVDRPPVTDADNPRPVGIVILAFVFLAVQLLFLAEAIGSCWGGCVSGKPWGQLLVISCVIAALVFVAFQTASHAESRASVYILIFVLALFSGGAILLSLAQLVVLALQNGSHAGA